MSEEATEAKVDESTKEPEHVHDEHCGHEESRPPHGSTFSVPWRKIVVASLLFAPAVGFALQYFYG